MISTEAKPEFLPIDWLKKLIAAIGVAGVVSLIYYVAQKMKSEADSTKSDGSLNTHSSAGNFELLMHLIDVRQKGLSDNAN